MNGHKNDRPEASGPVATHNGTPWLEDQRKAWADLYAREAGFPDSCTRAAAEGDESHLSICGECRGWADLVEDVEIEDTLTLWAEEDQ